MAETLPLFLFVNRVQFLSDYRTHSLQQVRETMATAHYRHTPDFSGPPTIEQIESQVRWEAAAVEAGVKRYHEELATPRVSVASQAIRRRKTAAGPRKRKVKAARARKTSKATT